MQAKQLRYLKIGGRVFLVVGVVVDTVQIAQAAVESYQQRSAKPLVAQAVRTAGTWAMAWAGAKAGMAVGGLAGAASGPGMVLMAIGGGLIGGSAGYFGADWIADLSDAVKMKRPSSPTPAPKWRFAATSLESRFL